ALFPPDDTEDRLCTPYKTGAVEQVDRCTYSNRKRRPRARWDGDLTLIRTLDRHRFRRLILDHDVCPVVRRRRFLAGRRTYLLDRARAEERAGQIRKPRPHVLEAGLDLVRQLVPCRSRKSPLEAFDDARERTAF